MKTKLRFVPKSSISLLYIAFCAFPLPPSVATAQDLILKNKQTGILYGNASQPKGCFRQGSLDFVTDRTRGLTIFDNTNPSVLMPIGNFFGPNMQPSGVSVDGALAVVGDEYAGIYLIDITDPVNPTQLIHFADGQSADPLWSVQQVWIVGNSCVVFGGEHVYVVDITTPTTPSITGRYNHNYAFTQGALSGNYIYFAAQDQGLQILDYSNPTTPNIVGGIPITDKYAGSVAVDGSTAYLGLGDSLEIIDISDVANPSSIKSLESLSGTEFLALSGNALYVIEYSTIAVVDVTTPSLAVETGSRVIFSGQPFDAKGVAGQLLLLTDEGYQVFDTTDEFTPSYVSRFNRDGLVNGIAVTGDHLVMVTGASGIQTADISQTFPYSNQPVSTGSFMADVVVNSTHAFVAAGARGLEVFDLSAPDTPVLVATLPLVGFAWGLDMSGSTIFVTVGDQGVVSVDVTDPLAPGILQALGTPGPAMNITLDGTVGYVASFLNGIQVLDIANPAAMSVIGSYDTSGEAMNSHLSGTKLYVADGPSGLAILDVTTPTVPVMIEQIQTELYLHDIAVNDDGLALVGNNSSKIDILDVSNPTRPKVSATAQYLNSELLSAELINGCWFLGGLYMDSFAAEPNPSFATTFSWPGFVPGGPLRMVCENSFLYLAAGTSGLIIYEISNPAEPVFAGNYPVEEFRSYFDVVIHNELAYLSGSTGVDIVDIGNPYFPQKVGNIPFNFGARTVKIHNNLAYVSVDSSGVGIYDLADPVNPSLVGFYNNENTTITGMEFLSTYGYFCAGYGGMIIMDLSDPTNPQEIFVDDFEEGVWDVQLEGNVLYISTDSAVKVVSVQNPQLPIVIAPAEIYGTQQQLHVVGTTAYTADSVYGMVIVEAAIPAFPVISSSTLIEGIGANGIHVCGNFAFVAGNTQLHVFDISDIETPDLVNVIPINAGHQILAQSGDLMVAGGNTFYSNSPFSIFTRLGGEWEFTSLLIASPPVDMLLEGSILHIATTGGVLIYDLDDPENPALLSEFESGGIGIVNAIYVNENFLYIANNNGVNIHNIADLQNPTPAGTWTTTATSYDVAVSGNYAFVADSYNGLQVLDVSNPLAPTPVTLIQPTTGGVFNLSLDGDKLLVMGQSSAAIVDISDPTQPVQDGNSFYTTLFGNITDGVIEGDTVFLAAAGGVESLDVSDTSSFVPVIGSYQSTFAISTVLRDNGETFAGGEGLLILRDVVIQPTLTIRRDGTSFEINWSPAGGGFQLEQRPAPGEGSWELVPFAQPPYFENFNQPQRIYRLSR